MFADEEVPTGPAGTVSARVVVSKRRVFSRDRNQAPSNGPEFLFDEPAKRLGRFGVEADGNTDDDDTSWRQQADGYYE